MKQKYSVKLTRIVKDLELSVLNAASDFEENVIETYEVSRPALPMAGFYSVFFPGHVQIIGRVELDYLKTLDQETREERIDQFFAHGPRVVVICSRVPPDSNFVHCARKYDCNLLTTDTNASVFMAQIITSLRAHLAPRTTVHGVLVEIHGEGVLIMGDSGIGKSETALELIKRGHRLIADDSVNIRRMSHVTVTGSAPTMIRHLMELRGVGLVDIRRLYGAGAVMHHAQIDLVVKLVQWQQGQEYDRLGLANETASFLGVKVPQVTIPVAPGRNLAIILEAAAINNRQKRMGVNTAEEFVKKYDADITNGLK